MHLNTTLNDRQKKVIQKMLSYLPNEFEGGMKVNKYMNITKSLRVTASRDLGDLVSKNIMQSHGKGRGCLLYIDCLARDFIIHTHKWIHCRNIFTLRLSTVYVDNT
ncbi:MAG: hypothetical protein COB42_02315 [Sulfurimonas sp.]|nr:MAG: hypothetical protein COB42_02315 [Sulfurimonas sp.]